MVFDPSQNVLLLVLVGILSLTLLNSLLIMVGGGTLFKKARKSSTSAYIPIGNLFTLLEIAEMSTFFGILFFIPGINVLIISIAYFRLGKAFNTGMGYKLGLLFFPLCFYPMLALSDKQYKVSDEEYFKALDNAKGDSINLLTDDEIKSQGAGYEEPQVDSIFKTEIQMMEEVAPYKAAKIDVEGLERLKAMTPEEDMFKPIEASEPVVFEKAPEEMENKQASKFTQELDKDEEVEYIDL